ISESETPKSRLETSSLPLFSTLPSGPLFCRLLVGPDDPPARPELPPGPDDPLPRPLPPFLFSLIMSSRDIFILSAIVVFKPLRNAENEQRSFSVGDLLNSCLSLRQRGVGTGGNYINIIRK
uniref:Uncharacterized protein n=1 Tax=Lates calcarifer TaxID=8187 RepID=A0A4W6DBD6_LATCA